MGFFCKSVLVTLLALWSFTSLVFAEELDHLPHADAPAPSPYAHPPHHHHKHHPHPHPHLKPSVPPVSPPSKPPVTPAHPPVKPPVMPPVKPPVSPTMPPVKPPVHPPVKNPVKPPTSPHVKPPAMPPVKPPTSPPVKPPVHPPVYPPKFNRSLVAVQGMVYCKTCKYAGVDTLLGATPVKGAVVRFECKGKHNTVKETTSDEKGYFFLLAPKTVTNYGFRGCSVKLVKSMNPKCIKASKINGGDIGGSLIPAKDKTKRMIVVNSVTYGLFEVGPFAFEPSCPR